MSGFLLLFLVLLVFVVLYQISKTSEYVTVLNGEDAAKARYNKLHAWSFIIFWVLFMAGVYYCHQYMLPKMLPVSASDHGVQFDSMLKVTVIITGIVFLITQFLLVYFAFRYQSTENRKSFYFPHSNKLELVWTVVPALAMTVLVAIGLRNWMHMTSEAPKNAMQVEVWGKQFNWIMRYPGADNTFGKRDYKLTNDQNNQLGQIWDDKNGLDDVHANELHLIKGTPVKLIIGSRDVIHDVGLAHFRMKMDAVPGIMTTMWFTPTVSTEEMKTITGNPNFVYEISCDQMCGRGHYSMRGLVIVHENKAEFDKWMHGMKPYYVQTGPGAQQAAAAPAAETAAPTAAPVDSAKAEAKQISMK